MLTFDRWTNTFVVTSDGGAYVRFRRALEIGNELLVLAAARELPRIALDDALRIFLVLRDSDSDRFQRAAVRWLGRFALEAREDLRLAAEALDTLTDRTAEAMQRLHGICGASAAIAPVPRRRPTPYSPPLDPIRPGL